MLWFYQFSCCEVQLDKLHGNLIGMFTRCLTWSWLSKYHQQNRHEYLNYLSESWLHDEDQRYVMRCNPSRAIFWCSLKHDLIDLWNEVIQYWYCDCATTVIRVSSGQMVTQVIIPNWNINTVSRSAQEFGWGAVSKDYSIGMNFDPKCNQMSM